MGLVDELISSRKSRRLSQEQLAKGAGLARGVVSKIETGAVDPSLSALVAYAGALDIELMPVPRTLRVELEGFVRSGGRYLGQPTGVGAPRSIVDEVLGRAGPDETFPESPWST